MQPTRRRSWTPLVIALLGVLPVSACSYPSGATALGRDAQGRPVAHLAVCNGAEGDLVSLAVLEGTNPATEPPLGTAPRTDRLREGDLLTVPLADIVDVAALPTTDPVTVSTRTRGGYWRSVTASVEEISGLPDGQVVTGDGVRSLDAFRQDPCGG